MLQEKKLPPFSPLLLYPFLEREQKAQDVGGWWCTGDILKMYWFFSDCTGRLLGMYCFFSNCRESQMERNARFGHKLSWTL